MANTALTDASSAPPSPTPASAEVAGVADGVLELSRTLGRARARMLAAAAHDVEWSAHVLLRVVGQEGPMRAGAVADCLHSDPSTVSRQVAALVRDGLLERRADPQDGRASLLVVTPKGEGVLAEHDRIRLNYFAHMLAEWDERELREFAGMLQRFTAAYGAVDDDWIRERIATASVHARSND